MPPTAKALTRRLTSSKVQEPSLIDGDGFAAETFEKLLFSVPICSLELLKVGVLSHVTSTGSPESGLECPSLTSRMLMEWSDLRPPTSPDAVSRSAKVISGSPTGE